MKTTAESERYMRKYRYILVNPNGERIERTILSMSKKEAVKYFENAEFIDGSKVLKSSFKRIG